MYGGHFQVHRGVVTTPWKNKTKQNKNKKTKQNKKKKKTSKQTNTPTHPHTHIQKALYNEGSNTQGISLECFWKLERQWGSFYIYESEIIPHSYVTHLHFTAFMTVFYHFTCILGLTTFGSSVMTFF